MIAGNLMSTGRYSLFCKPRIVEQQVLGPVLRINIEPTNLLSTSKHSLPFSPSTDRARRSGPDSALQSFITPLSKGPTFQVFVGTMAQTISIAD